MDAIGLRELTEAVLALLLLVFGVGRWVGLIDTDRGGLNRAQRTEVTELVEAAYQRFGKRIDEFQVKQIEFDEMRRREADLHERAASREHDQMREDIQELRKVIDRRLQPRD